MTRKELIQKIADTLNEKAMETAKVTRPQVERIVDCLFDKVVPATLEEGQEVVINNFGVFEPRKRDAREGRNPQTGETIQIEEKMGIGFRASSVLKKRLN